MNDVGLIRCVQCERTLDILDDVWLNDQLVPLHRGGCPDPTWTDEADYRESQASDHD